MITSNNFTESNDRLDPLIYKMERIINALLEEVTKVLSVPLSFNVPVPTIAILIALHFLAFHEPYSLQKFSTACLIVSWIWP